MSEKLNIEQLFRKGLEGAELSPSPRSWTAIQRKLRWKQFLRFNPTRFNIYYAGAILLAGIGLTLLLAGKGDQAELGVPDQQVLPEFPLDGKMVDSPDKSVNTDSRRPIGKEEIQPADSRTMESEELDTDSVTASEPEEKALDEKDYEPKVETHFMAPVISNGSDKDLEKKQLSAANFTSTIQTGCAPLRVQFIDQSIRATSYHWDFGTGDISREKNPMYEFREAGRYMVTLTTENNGSQLTVSRMMIEVLDPPVADFQIEEGLVGMDGHVVLSLVNYSIDASSFAWCLVDEASADCSNWQSSDHQPNLELKSITPNSRSVRLEVIGENGCRDTAVQELPLVVQSSDTRIKFANAFSPNPSGPGDGSFAPGSKRIDLFHPIYIEVPVEFHMRVFNRRGELVFETREIYQGWDGYYKQMPASNDVYVWMADGKWKDGTSFSHHGDVTLVPGQYW